MANLFQQSGGQPQKQPKYTPIFEDRMFTGLYTQRAQLHDPSDIYTARYYGGRPDALLDGRNIELTNRMTLQRRPGMVPFRSGGGGSGFSYPTTPDRAFSYQLADGTIRVIIDTASSGALAITAAANASGGTTAYTGTFPGGGSNGYVGLTFTVAGFPAGNGQDNGVFTCTASTTTTLTLNNPNGVAVTNAATATTPGGIYWDKQDGTATLLYGKQPGAGQGYFIAIAGILYFGDGVDTKKYTPLNPNGTIWNWGVVAPAKQPTVVTSTGAANTAWQASTVFSTMGLTFDTNASPNIWQVIGTNGDASNPPTNPQFGTTGTGEPNWGSATAVGSTLTDGTVTWENAGVLNDWQSNTFYADGGTNTTFTQPTAIAVASVTGIYQNQRNSGSLGKTEGPSSEPHFTGSHPGPNYPENNNSGNNGLNWFPIFNWGSSSGSKPLRWKQSTAYQGWFAGSPTGSQNQISGAATNCVISGNLPSTTATPVYLFIPKVGGTTGSGYAPFPASATFGQTVSDGQIVWMCMGPKAWTGTTKYTAWSAQGTAFSVIYDTGTSTFQVCVTGGTSQGSTPTFGSTYGTPTVESTGVKWVCVGPSVTWSSGQIWNFPIGGFTPPQGTSPFGGSTVTSTVSGNNYLQTVISSGTSQTPGPPSWVSPSAAPPTTTDNTITWKAIGPSLTQTLTWSYGFAYAYSYKSRAVTDFYAPAPLGGGNTPPGLTNSQAAPFALPPTGSETNTVSTASPVFQIVGPNTSGAVNTISGVYSPDPQIDTIIIWRSADSASGANNMFELTEIPNVVGTGTWSFQDYLPSVASGTFPGLNVLIPAPINGSNNPPPSTFLPQVFNYQRIWGANGQNVPFTGGPDISVGNPNECFNPSDTLPFLAPVIRLFKTSQGIATFLTDSIEMIGGGPTTASFFSVTMAPGVGLLSYNAADIYAGEIYFFSADNQFHALTPALNLSNFGFPLGDQFANQPAFGSSATTWNPAKVYVAVHQNGVDNCIFVADGSTGWYRCNPHQIPGGAQGPEPIWSPFASINAGACGMVQSVETSPGIKQLLAGSTSPAQQILSRSLTTFTDNSLSYDAYFVMGSIKLAEPGQMALLKFLEMDFSGVSFQPTISYLLNEISGTFTPFVNNTATNTPQFDPPSLYGETIIPASYSPNRYYFSSNSSLAACKHMQIKVDFGGGNATYTAMILTAQVVSNVLTLTVNSAAGFAPGQTITISGVTGASFLNGQQVTITSVVGNTITAAFTHANYQNITNIDVSDQVGSGTSTVWTYTATSTLNNDWAFFASNSTPQTGSIVTTGSMSTLVNPPILLAQFLGAAGSAPTATETVTSTTGFNGVMALFKTNGSTPVTTQVALTTNQLVNPIVTGSTNPVPNVAGTQLILALYLTNLSDVYSTTQSTVTDTSGNTWYPIGIAHGTTPFVGVEWTVLWGCYNPVINVSPTFTITTKNAAGTSLSYSGAAAIYAVTNLVYNLVPDTGTITTTVNTGSTNGDEMYNLTIYGRHIVEL